MNRRPTTNVFIAWLIVLAAVWLPTGPAGAGPGAVTVADRPEVMETELHLSVDGCVVAWTLHRTALNKRVVSQRTDCRAPLATQAELIGRLLEQAVRRPDFKAADTLFIGRLYQANRDSLEAPRRLALAAHQSPDWDSTLGRPKAGLLEMNRLTARLADRAGVLKELVQTFDRAGYRLRVVSVEKVIAVEAGQTPFYAWLADRGVRPGEKLPIDCLTWLRFTRRDPGRLDTRRHGGDRLGLPGPVSTNN